MLSRMKVFDAFPKTMEDFRIRTTSGATVSVIAGIFILWLFLSEFSYWLQLEVKPVLKVDTTRGEKLRINFDITFHAMSCAWMSVDAMDVSGEHQKDVYHHIFKTNLDSNGVPLAEGSKKESLKRDKAKIDPKNDASKKPGYCGSCYGSEAKAGQCCNTCDEVRESYRIKGWAFTNPDGIEQCAREGFSENLRGHKGEQCKLYGYLLVNKVAGNFHFSPGFENADAFSHIHDVGLFKFTGFNMTHTVNKLSFGTEFPGVVNPLDSVKKIWDEPKMAPMYQYFIKVVPTTYEHLNSETIYTNQFSVTEHVRKLEKNSNQGLPGVFFMYDLSPIMVTFTESRKSFAHFLTGVCAIVGGVFTVAGILDSFIYHGLKSLAKKQELGKAS
mmetsp:Transcript_13445/g.14876  ORF Transcript_13445/g.14876 Transcript_13445/m.14876 type:complete len:385 (+) Transcript_13445:75-1229(+)